MCVHKCACVYGGQRSTLDIFFNHIPSQGLSLSLGLIDFTRLTGQWTTGIYPFPPPPRAGVRDVTTLPGRYVGPGDLNSGTRV